MLEPIALISFLFLTFILAQGPQDQTSQSQTAGPYYGGGYVKETTAALKQQVSTT